MIIHSITFNDFGAYQGKQAVAPAVSRDGSPSITLVGGLNGVGKTSLLEAVLLALYGNRSPSARESGVHYAVYLKSLVNKDTLPGNEAWVELQLELDGEDGTELLWIRRSWSHALRDGADRLEVRRNGNLDSYLASNWSTYVEELLPVGLAGLFFFDGEKISSLAGTDETPQHVKHSIRSLLGLDLVDRLIDDLNTVIKRSAAALDNAQIRDTLNELMDDKRRYLTRQDELRQRIAHINTEVAVAEKNLNLKNEEYIRSGGALISQREEHLAELERLRESSSELKLDLVALAGGALPLILVRKLLNQSLTTVQHEAKHREARSGLPLLVSRNDQLKKWLTEMHLPGAEDLVRILETHESEVRTLAEKTSSLALSPAGEAQLAYFLESLHHELCQTAEASAREFNDTSHHYEELQRRLSSQFNEESISDILWTIADLTQEIELQNQRAVELDRDVARLEYDIERLDRAIEVQAAQLVNASDASRIVTHAVKAQDTLRQFRSTVTRQKVNQLATCILESFNVLTRKDSLVSRIDIDPESLSITLYDSQHREVPKLRLASGEKQMLAISILWGLAKASGRRLPIIVDTPMGRLDSSHRMNFVSKYLPGASHQVIVLSTDTEIIGPYLNALRPSIGRSYLLTHDEASGTKIVDGYFETAGVSPSDS